MTYTTSYGYGLLKPHNSIVFVQGFPQVISPIEVLFVVIFTSFFHAGMIKISHTADLGHRIAKYFLARSSCPANRLILLQE